MIDFSKIPKPKLLMACLSICISAWLLFTGYNYISSGERVIWGWALIGLAILSSVLKYYELQRISNMNQE